MHSHALQYVIVFPCLCERFLYQITGLERSGMSLVVQNHRVN